MGTWYSGHSDSSDIRIDATPGPATRCVVRGVGVDEGPQGTVLYCACDAGGRVLSGSVYSCRAGTSVCAGDFGGLWTESGMVDVVYKYLKITPVGGEVTRRRFSSSGFVFDLNFSLLRLLFLHSTTPEVFFLSMSAVLSIDASGSPRVAFFCLCLTPPPSISTSTATSTTTTPTPTTTRWQDATTTTCAHNCGFHRRLSLS